MRIWHMWTSRAFGNNCCSYYLCGIIPIIFIESKKKMKLLSLIAIILSFGCMSKVVNKTEKQDLNPIHNISFEQADLDSNGDLSEAEFATAQQSHGIDTKTPVLWFVVLIFLIGIMVYLTKFLKM